MNSSALRDEVLQVVKATIPNIPEAELADGSLVSRGIIDSLSLMEVTAALETKFNIAFTPEYFSAENFENLDRIVETVSRLQGGSAQ